MTLRELFTSSPLGCIGMALMGVVFALQYGMAAVYAVEAGLTLAQTSIFIAAFYVGALIFQYPLGMLSDRIDRRIVIAFTAAMGGIAATTAALFSGNFSVLVAAAVLIGGAANPLYSLLIAHTSDFLDYEDMAAASAGLQFLNGIFAVIGPLVTGYLMVQTGPQAFFVLIALPMLLLVGYALYRATRRPVAEDTNEFVPMLHTSSVMSLEAAQDIWTEDEPDEADASDPGDGAARPQVA